MLESLFKFILSTAVSLMGMLFLLRAWLYYLALSPRHPLAEICRKATDWLMNPLSKILPRKGGIDRASLAGALAAAAVGTVVNALLTPAHPGAGYWIAAPFATVMVWALEMLSWSTLFWVIASWLAPTSLMGYTFQTMVDPFVRPIRRVVPVVKNIDFSPFILIVAANILQMFIRPFAGGMF